MYLFGVEVGDCFFQSAAADATCRSLFLEEVLGQLQRSAFSHLVPVSQYVVPEVGGFPVLSDSIVLGEASWKVPPGRLFPDSPEPSISLFF
jgi:hypothetical protein